MVVCSVSVHGVTMVGYCWFRYSGVSLLGGVINRGFGASLLVEQPLGCVFGFDALGSQWGVTPGFDTPRLKEEDTMITWMTFKMPPRRLHELHFINISFSPVAIGLIMKSSGLRCVAFDFELIPYPLSYACLFPMLNLYPSQSWLFVSCCHVLSSITKKGEIVSFMAIVE